MDITMQTSIVALISLTITSLSGIVLAYITYKTQALGREVKKNTAITGETASTMKQLEINTNHKFDELLRVTESASKAEGKLEARQEDRDAVAAAISPEVRNILVVEAQAAAVEEAKKRK